jgi:hypothetical protein
MNNKDKLIKVLQEIGIDFHEYETESANVVCLDNDEYDIEEAHFSIKFNKVTGEYFE